MRLREFDLLFAKIWDPDSLIFVFVLVQKFGFFYQKKKVWIFAIGSAFVFTILILFMDDSTDLFEFTGYEWTQRSNQLIWTSWRSRYLIWWSLVICISLIGIKIHNEIKLFESFFFFFFLQSVPANNETSASFKSSHEPAVVVHPAKVTPLSGPYGLAGDFAGHLPSSILSPQAQGFYYRGWFVILLVVFK